MMLPVRRIIGRAGEQLGRASSAIRRAVPMIAEVRRNFEEASLDFAETSRTFRDRSLNLAEASRNFRDRSLNVAEASRNFGDRSSKVAEASRNLRDRSSNLAEASRNFAEASAMFGNFSKIAGRGSGRALLSRVGDFLGRATLDRSQESARADIWLAKSRMAALNLAFLLAISRL